EDAVPDRDADAESLLFRGAEGGVGQVLDREAVAIAVRRLHPAAQRRVVGLVHPPILHNVGIMRICVAGAGAIGGFIGTKLAAAGRADVCALARGATLEALRRDGWRVASAGGVLQ